MDPDQRPGTMNTATLPPPVCTFLHHKYYEDTVNRATPSDKISYFWTFPTMRFFDDLFIPHYCHVHKRQLHRGHYQSILEHE